MEYGALGMGHGVWGTGHRVWGTGHGAWGMGHEAWGRTLTLASSILCTMNGSGVNGRQGFRVLKGMVAWILSFDQICLQ